MKKRSLLAIVLSFALILSVCTCSFGGLVASATTTAPSFDPWSSETIATYSTQLFSESLTVLAVPEYDTSKAVYSRTKVTRNDANTLNTTPVILLAKTNSARTSGAGYEFNNSYLAMWLAASGGYSIALISSQYVDGPLVAGTTYNFYASGHDSVTGFAGWGGTWPGGASNVQNSQEIITKIENGRISVWIKTSAGVKEVLRDYVRADAFTSCTSIAAGYATSQKLSNDYNYACEIWSGVDFENRTQVGNFETQVITEEKTVLNIAKYESDAAVYSKTTVTRNDANVLNTTPVILLAETDSDLTHAERGNFKNSHLVMWMSAGGGYAIGLLGSDVTGTAAFPTSFLKLADQTSVTGFAGYSGLYPGGGTSILNYQEVITKIENGKISVWMKDSAGNVKEILREYSHADYNITGPAAGYLSSAINSNRYNYACEVWVDDIVEVVDPNSQPEFDETAQRKVLSFVSTGLKSNTTMEFFNYSNRIVDGSAVYTSLVADMASSYGTFDGPFVALAKADYKADENDTLQYYWGVRLTDVSGWTFGLFSESPTAGIVGGFYIDYDNAYSNGSYAIPTDGVKINSKVADGAISVWIDDELYIDSFTGKNDVAVVAPVLGLCTLNSHAKVSMAQVSVWVDNADYGYLGDLNADMEINIIDLVIAEKIAVNPGISAFNDNVKAFNSEGTIGATELVLFKKFLLGIINTFEVPPEYGENITPAEGLL